MLHRIGGEIVEQPLAAGELGDQHHADQEQIDVETLADAGEGVRCRDQAERDEQDGARHGPDRFGQPKRADDDAGGGGDDDGVSEPGIVQGHGQRWIEQIIRRR